MFGDAVALASGQAVPGVVAESFDGPAAVAGGGGVGDVRLQPRLAEPFARTVGERRDAVGADTEDGGDLVRVHPLHLGVPEHRLPALGKAAERAGRQGAVEGDHRGIVAFDDGLEFADVVDVDALVGAAPSGSQVADGRVQVRTEGPVRAATGEHALVDAHVRLGHEVVGVAR